MKKKSHSTVESNVSEHKTTTKFIRKKKLQNCKQITAYIISSINYSIWIVMFAYRIYLWVFEVEVICNGNFFSFQQKSIAAIIILVKNLKRLKIDKSSKFSVFTINHRI